VGNYSEKGIALFVFLGYNDKRDVLRCASIQDNGQTGATGLADDIITQGSRSRPPALAGAPAVAGERAALGL
jgi:hypothetical protein